MPTDTTVHRMFIHLKSAGYPDKEAAKIAQEKTGLSLVTGRPPKPKEFKNGKK